MRYLRRDGHTHPNIMKIPQQAEDFVSAAVAAGMDELVMSDHMPFSVTGDEHDRIPAGAVGDYCRAVSECAAKYSESIRILCGIEIDYRQECEYEIREVLSSGSFDVVLGSSHLNIRGFGIPFGSISKDDFAEMVFENYLAAAESGMFDVLTHLDVFRRTAADTAHYPMSEPDFDLRRHESVLRHIFREMERRNIALEISAAPLYQKFDDLGQYPSDNILRIASDYELRRVYGSDAHSAAYVGFAYDRLAEYIFFRKK